MSDPTGGEPNPFADIIDLFREVEAANEASAADSAPPRPAVPYDASPTAPHSHAARLSTALLSVEPPRGGTPITPKSPAPAPSKRRRAVLLLPVALMAMTGGATAAVIHQHGDPSTAAGPAASAASTGSADGALPSPAAPTDAAVSPGASAPGPVTAAYSTALDALAAASGPRQLTAATTRLPAAIARLRAVHGALPRAEAAHLDSLLALCRLDRLTDYPALASAAAKASARVEEASAGRSGVPDPTLATDNVVTTAARAVAERLDGRVAQLASAAAQAKLTAQLRGVARQATALAPTATSAAGALAGAHDGDRAGRATAEVAALHALGSLSVIDGEHLDAWTALSAPLQQALAAAGVSAAATDIDAVDAMIAAARQKMLAWAAADQATEAGGNGNGNGNKAAAKQTEAAIDSYLSSASALLGRYDRAIAGLPVVGPGQQASPALTARFVTSAVALAALTSAVARLDPPAGMGEAQQALAGLVGEAHAAAAAGQAVAANAQSCDSAVRSCAYGTQRHWPDYAAGVAALGHAGPVRATLASAASTAKKAAAKTSATGAAVGSSTAGAATTLPPKPVV